MGRDGGIGRRGILKRFCASVRAGSSPAPGMFDERVVG